MGAPGVHVCVPHDGEAGDDGVVEGGAEGLAAVDLAPRLVLHLPAGHHVPGDQHNGGYADQHGDEDGDDDEGDGGLAPEPVHTHGRHAPAQGPGAGEVQAGAADGFLLNMWQ